MQNQLKIPNPVLLSDLTSEQREWVDIIDLDHAPKWRWKDNTPDSVKQSGVWGKTET